MKKHPKITIVIPTYNEEKNIEKCLKSIFRQNYPQDKLEIILVDNYSKDKTVAVAKQFPVKIIYSRLKNPERSKMLAFRQAQGELFYYLDADVELVGRNWFVKMLKPLLEDATLIGSFTHKYQKPGDVPVNRYLTYHLTQCDPVYEFFSVSIPSTVIEEKKGYKVCFYKPGKIPPAGRCLYWREKLLKTTVAQMDKFMELDILEILAKAGYQRFAWVPSAGVYHCHIQGLKELFKKRLRNIEMVYLPDYSHRHFTWFDFRSSRGILKIIIWVLYAHLIFPAILKGAYKALKHRDIYCLLYEPILTIILTDVIIYGFLKQPRGRQFFLRCLKASLAIKDEDE